MKIIEARYRKIGEKVKYHKPIIFRGRNMKTKTDETKTVKRIVKGKEQFISPAENFRREANKRLANIEKEFELLSRCNGKDFEKSPEQLNTIESLICGWYDIAITALKNPTPSARQKTVKQYI